MSTDYWKSPEGIERRVEMLGEDFCFRTVNNALQAYGRANDVLGWYWIGSIDERTCNYCDSQMGRFYRIGQFLPILPSHAGCRCEWELVPREYEEPVSYRVDPRSVPEQDRPKTIKDFYRNRVWEREWRTRSVTNLEQGIKGETMINLYNDPLTDYYGKNPRQQFLNAVGKIPSTHMQGIKEIRLVPMGDVPGGTSGYYDHGERTITIFDKALGIESTVNHEVGHNIRSHLMTKEQQSEWVNVWNRAKQDTSRGDLMLPSNLAEEREDEGFAECYAAYRGGGSSWDLGVAPYIKNWFNTNLGE